MGGPLAQTAPLYCLAALFGILALYSLFKTVALVCTGRVWTGQKTVHVLITLIAIGLYVLSTSYFTTQLNAQFLQHDVFFSPSCQAGTEFTFTSA